MAKKETGGLPKAVDLYTDVWQHVEARAWGEEEVYDISVRRKLPDEWVGLTPLQMQRRNVGLVAQVVSEHPAIAKERRTRGFAWLRGGPLVSVRQVRSDGFAEVTDSNAWRHSWGYCPMTALAFDFDAIPDASLRECVRAFQAQRQAAEEAARVRQPARAAYAGTIQAEETRTPTTYLPAAPPDRRIVH